MKIIHAESDEHYQAARHLFTEYAASLGFDLEFQAFREELATLSGEYAPPTGDLLLAESDGTPVGCVAIRELDDRVCEMKRLYVVPEYRRHSVGRALATAIITAARHLCYSSMRLDTVPSMRGARHLYESIGFQEIEAYRYNPIEGATFMELSLAHQNEAV